MLYSFELSHTYLVWDGEASSLGSDRRCALSSQSVACAKATGGQVWGANDVFLGLGRRCSKLAKNIRAGCSSRWLGWVWNFKAASLGLGGRGLMQMNKWKGTLDIWFGLLQ
eukprot:6295886-Ditylum_brightwellii.AAC.2